ncbi:MAG: hypothetical protein HQ530_02780 [Parcubacteria group bacterium]|nr:hypothetical protein [Parcubacteria group bacterium]
MPTERILEIYAGEGLVLLINLVFYLTALVLSRKWSFDEEENTFLDARKANALFGWIGGTMASWVITFIAMIFTENLRIERWLFLQFMFTVVATLLFLLFGVKKSPSEPPPEED